jgi:hypothetical protein
MNNDMMKDLDQPSLTRTAVIGGIASFVLNLIFALIPFVACCLGFISPLLGLAVGAGYTYFTEGKGRKVTPQSGAIGGGIVGAVVGVAGAIGAGIGSAMWSMFLASDVGSAAAGSAVSLVFGIFAGIVFGAILGVVGGAGYAWYLHRNDTASTPPPAM